MPDTWVTMKVTSASAPVTARFPVAVRSQGLNGNGSRPTRLQKRMKKNIVQKKPR